MLTEYFFTCPYCWQQISILLDISSGGQSYVEDCETCCNPISITYETEGSDITSFSAEAEQ